MLSLFLYVYFFPLPFFILSLPLSMLSHPHLHTSYLSDYHVYQSISNPVSAMKSSELPISLIVLFCEFQQFQTFEINFSTHCALTNIQLHFQYYIFNITNIQYIFISFEDNADILKYKLDPISYTFYHLMSRKFLVPLVILLEFQNPKWDTQFSGQIQREQST